MAWQFPPVFTGCCLDCRGSAPTLWLLVGTVLGRQDEDGRVIGRQSERHPAMKAEPRRGMPRRCC